MFSLFRKKKRSFQLNDTVSKCVKKLLIYRMKNDDILRDQIIENVADIESVEDTVGSLSSEQLSTTTEFYIVYLIAIYADLLLKAGNQFSYKDIVYTIDQNLPKPKGHIPVQMWSPENYPEYIKYRLTIDYSNSAYPMFLIDNMFEEIFSCLSNK